MGEERLGPNPGYFSCFPLMTLSVTVMFETASTADAALSRRRL